MTRILSLDDSPEILKILHLFLELAGYEHLRTVESEAALSILRTEAIDLFTQDCIRPDVHGIELYKRLKADEQLRRIPVLFISAGQRPEFAAECRSVYGDDYLTKPFQLETVLSTVAALLQRRGKHIPTEKERAERYAQIRAGLATVAGQYVLKLLSISEPSLTTAGGIILFLIAIKMVFPTAERTHEPALGGEPFIVPLAIPYVAGPSALSAVLFIMSRDAARWPEWLLAILVAWFLSGAILMAAQNLSNYLGERGLIAIERLMGMILITIAVQMTMTGMSQFLALGVPK